MNWFYPTLLKAYDNSGYAHTETLLEEYRNKKGYYTPNLDIGGEE